MNELVNDNVCITIFIYTVQVCTKHRYLTASQARYEGKGISAAVQCFVIIFFWFTFHLYQKWHFLQ